MNNFTSTSILARTRDQEALETRAANREQRAQRQLLDHYRDLQAALHALSNDFGVLGIDLPYSVAFTKSFSAQAPGGPPVKALLCLTLSEIPRHQPRVPNHKSKKSAQVGEADAVLES